MTLKISPLSKVGTFTYANGKEFSLAVRYLYPVDLNGDGIDEIIFAGFESQPNSPATYTNTKISIFGWKNKKFQDLSADWLPNGAGGVEGVGDVGAGDFNGDGKLDVFLSAYTDMDHPANAYQLINRGGYLEKTVLENVNGWQHGVAVADVNNDGYADVFATGYGPYRLYLGSPGGLKINPIAQYAGGSGVALGDFFGNKSTSVILVDHDAHNGKDTALYKFVQGDSGLDVSFSSSLPKARLDLPKYGTSASPFGQSHDIRAIPFDFSRDGLADAIVISAASADLVEQLGHRLSEVQFLLNRSNGLFEDVTDQYLKGYNNRAGSPYHPVLVDANNDGLIDIFLSEADWTSTPHASTSILVQQDNGTFVATGINTFSPLISNDGGIASLLRGPDNKKYLVVESQSQEGRATVKLGELYFSNRPLPVNTDTLSFQLTEGKSFQHMVSKSVFLDARKNNVLTYGSENLPDWLTLDARSGSLSGRPTYTAADAPNAEFTLTATNRDGASASVKVMLSVTNTPLIKGTKRSDSLIAGNGADRIDGSEGNDTLAGGSGDDQLTGGRGNDSLTGNEGSDSFIFSPGDCTRKLGFDVITDYTKGKPEIGDLIDFSVDLIYGGKDGVANTNQASINQYTGIASFHAGSGNTLADAVKDVATSLTASEDAAGEFAFFKVNTAGDYFLFISDGVKGVSSRDVVIRLTGVESVGSIDLTGGNLTITT